MFRKRVYGGGNFHRRPFKKAKVPVSAKVQKLQRQVALLKPELKENAITMSTSNITQAAGAIYHVSDIIQGTNDGNRIGDQVRIESMRLRGAFSDSAAVNCVRFVLVRDKSSNGAAPVIGSTVQSIFYNFVARQGQQQPLNKKRFTILWEHACNGLEATLATRSAGLIDSGYIKLTAGPTTYTATAGNITDAGTNQYYLIILVDGADTLDWNGLVNIRFTDV